MKRQILNADETARNKRLKELHLEKLQKSVQPKTKDQIICDMVQSNWDNTISKSGMTYLEIEQFDNKYNNF
jgi:hypothetical protein